MSFTHDADAGEFSAIPQFRLIDTPGGPNRKVELVDDLTFTEKATGTVWDAPGGSIVDGASIPRALWALVGSPFTGDYVYASIIHDVACDAKTHPWRDVHYMFYRACLAGGTRRGLAKVLYLAVRNFGPRWDQPGQLKGFGLEAAARLASSLDGPTVTAESEEEYVRRAQEYVEQHGDDVSIEAIDVHASRPDEIGLNEDN